MKAVQAQILEAGDRRLGALEVTGEFIDVAAPQHLFGLETERFSLVTAVEGLQVRGANRPGLGIRFELGPGTQRCERRSAPIPPSRAFDLLRAETME